MNNGEGLMSFFMACLGDAASHRQDVNPKLDDLQRLQNIAEQLEFGRGRTAGAIPEAI